MLNEPQWVEVHVESPFSDFHGKFLIQPFLSVGEKADAARLGQKYTVGVDPVNNSPIYELLYDLAILKFHIKDTDADWWKKRDGLDLLDDTPVFALVKKIDEVRASLLKKKELPEPE